MVSPAVRASNYRSDDQDEYSGGGRSSLSYNGCVVKSFMTDLLPVLIRPCSFLRRASVPNPHQRPPHLLSALQKQSISVRNSAPTRRGSRALPMRGRARTHLRATERAGRKGHLRNPRQRTRRSRREDEDFTWVYDLFCDLRSWFRPLAHWLLPLAQPLCMARIPNLSYCPNPARVDW